MLTACNSWHTHDTGQDTSNQPQLTLLQPRQPWQPYSCRTPVRARSTHRQPALRCVDTSTSSSSSPSQATQQGTSRRRRLQTEAEADPTDGPFESFLVQTAGQTHVHEQRLQVLAVALLRDVKLSQQPQECLALQSMHDKQGHS